MSQSAFSEMFLCCVSLLSKATSGVPLSDRLKRFPECINRLSVTCSSGVFRHAAWLRSVCHFPNASWFSECFNMLSVNCSSGFRHAATLQAVSDGFLVSRWCLSSGTPLAYQTSARRKLRRASADVRFHFQSRWQRYSAVGKHCVFFGHCRCHFPSRW